MTEDEGRAAIVAEARSWLRTPYHPGARLKGVGVDCGQILIGVFVGAGIVEPFEVAPYAQDHHVHRASEQYMGELLRRGHRIAGPPKPGDVALWQFGRAFSHGAIVIAWPQVLHAVMREGLVTLGDADRDVDLIDRPLRFFSFWAPDGR